MGKYEGWLFVSDVDGTLLSNPEYTLSQENKTAIKEFMEEGGYFTFASGRCLFALEPWYRELEINAPVIAGNGALIYDPKTDTFPYVSALDKKKSEEMYDYVMSRFDGLGFEIFNDRTIYFIDDNSSIQHHIRSEHLPYPFVPWEEAKGTWTKLVFGVVPEDMEKVRDIVFSAPSADAFTIAQGGQWYLELSDKNTCKGISVLKVAEVLNIQKDRIITLGDNENDISMFAITPHSFVVSDAAESVKETASHTVGIGGSHGRAVRDVLEMMF